MFECFFPRPKLFFGSFALVSLACVIGWFTLGETLARQLSLGGLVGLGVPGALASDADDAARAAYSSAMARAMDVFFYQYVAVCSAAFAGFWLVYAPHKWARWSVLGSILIIFVIWYQVQVDVMINEWFGSFYDLIQQALSVPNSIKAEDFWHDIWTFFSIAVVAITVAVINLFFVSHYVFRWRTAMTEYYAEKWPLLRHIEGASQRVQEDTMRFASTMEALGTRVIDTGMTLIAFLPILWSLSGHVKELPLVGEVPDSLVFVAILWAAFGTALLAVAGMRLPGLEFRNQRVEAAYRKELVLGEDDHARAEPITLRELFMNVRHNYFRLYFNYLYFNIVRYAYLQTDAIFAYVILGPTIIAGTITLGIMQQISRAFGRVTNSFQFLVNSWTTIVELISIYKRIKAFEAAMLDKPLDRIEREPASGLGPGRFSPLPRKPGPQFW